MHYIKITFFFFILTFIFFTSSFFHSYAEKKESIADCMDRLYPPQIIDKRPKAKEVIDYIKKESFQDKRIAVKAARQPEVYLSLTKYIELFVNNIRVPRGVFYKKSLEKDISVIESTWDVDTEIVLSIWGVETNYGSNMGDINVAHALANMACYGSPYRQSFGIKELNSLLNLHEKGSLNGVTVTGSWAGAIGHTQFLPSSIEAYAVDYDKDGIITLNDPDNPLDALASTANYFKQNGWKHNVSPLLYVERLKTNNPSNKYIYRQTLLLEEWTKLFFIPRDDSKCNSSYKYHLWNPYSWTLGEMFLLSHNFDVIKRYNMSDKYAAAVSLLAQSIKAGVPITNIIDLPPGQDISVSDIMRIQKILQDKKLYIGGIDGKIGQKTRDAIMKFQIKNDLPIADGSLNEETLALLK